MGCVQGRKNISLSFMKAHPTLGNSILISEKGILQNRSTFVNNGETINATVLMNSNTIQSGVRKINDNYIVMANISFKSASQIFKVYDIKSKEHKAMKVIPKTKIINENFFLKELSIIKTIDSECTVKFYDYFSDKDFYYFIYEYIEGKNLYQYAKNVNLKEDLVKIIIQKVLYGLLVLNANKIAHRHITLENIMIVTDKDNDIHEVKIINFNNCCELESLNSSCNEFFIMETDDKQEYMFLAPEIFMNFFSYKIDIWSCGVLLYYLMYKKFPYNVKNINDLKNKAQIEGINFDIKSKEIYSEELYSLLKSMLTFNPSSRPNPYKCLESSVFNGKVIEKKKNGLRSVCEESIKQIIQKIYLQEDFTTLKSLYEELEVSSQNFCTYDLIYYYFNIKKPNECKGEQIITYDEFIELVLSPNMILNDKNIKFAFKLIDSNEDNMLTYEDFKTFLPPSENLFYFLMSLEEKEINFNEFKKALLNYRSYI